jgi:hypothetical protein
VRRLFTNVNVWRAATAAVAVAIVVLGLRLLESDGDRVERPDPRAGEVGVQVAISTAERDPLVVRGFIYEGPGGLGLRLCEGLKAGDPPRCIGPFLDLDGVDRGSFGMTDGDVDGEAVRWSDDSIALRGTIVGTRMQVLQVLA